MPSGGSRARSGPAPDPNALRRDRNDDKEWTTLPAEGFQGEVPAWPLASVDGAELDLWETLWRKPQGSMWLKLGLEFEVAAYVRAFLESVEPKATSGLKTAVLRMGAEIGLSTPGMHVLRWKFATDELGERREAAAPQRESARDRMRRLNA